MYMKAFILAFISTIIMSLSVIFLKWMVAQVGLTLFTMVTVAMSLVFWIAMEETENE